ncbi:MAG: UDP-2,4-diacetamido-2,4,6-trideoxy-beta-L-altropyranose hydrolase [Selenomonas sp.]|nr:UDP-2,4-diacetamido-2,4,6-trideoxy-beta-L-altropyranose hydrolase [Selenomonas sp.]
MSDAGSAVIRVDSSEMIGSGHLMRCLTLADRMRREGTEVHFICRDLVGNLNHLVREQGFPLHVLPRHADDPSLSGYAAWLTVAQETDARETGEVLSTFAPIMRLVVDSYALDEAWERIVHPLVGELFVIDDLANRKHDCDILLDQNFYRAMRHRYDGLVPPSCKLLLGPAHALLREEFYAAKKKLRRRDGNLRRILVFYGGSDITHETEKAVRALLHLSLPTVEVDVIIGGSNAHRMQIEELCAPHDFLHTYCAVSNMAEFMANADLCLGAGGTTTWERCFLGLPAIVTAIAENQLEICLDCADAGLIYYLGRWDVVTEMALHHALRVMTKPEALTRIQNTCRLDVEHHVGEGTNIFAPC